MEWHKEAYTISTDADKLSLEVICAYLVHSYWGCNRSPQIIERSIRNSLCFGLYQHQEQIGFARVITDRATFFYLMDVFVLEAHQGRGLGKWLIDCVLSHSDLQGLRGMLATRDAHALYEKFGFKPLDNPQLIMRR